MTSRSPFTFHHITAARHRSMSDRSQTFRPERYSDLVRRPEGFISVPRKLPSITKENDHGGSHKPTKLLLKVNIERSLGPVHVFMSPEKTVGDLVKTAVEIYVKEKRRPLLKETDPDCFELHYSQFSLESKLLLYVFHCFQLLDHIVFCIFFF